ncbi:MAG TPA: 50S ribosomal protein L9 [Micavibrio sp.]|jgi:large subunit ribosomal protein L9
MANMEVILLERVEHLGSMGETVRVKPGYARNYLLPEKKALRATNENKAYFESQRAALEKHNAEKRDEAGKLAKKLEGLKVTLIRNAAEGGQLYGSVTTRDIAEAVTAQSKINIDRTMVQLNAGFKLIGLFPVTLMLHPEVKMEVTVNIARSEEEAKIQAKTGKALVAEDDRVQAAPAVDSKAALMDEEALANEVPGMGEQPESEPAQGKKTRKAKKESVSEDAAE